MSACAAFTGQKKIAWNSALDLRAHLADDLMHLPDFATLQHYDAFPWMVAVKLGLWTELAAEAIPDSGSSYARALWHYAQGVRKARSGDAPGARTELTALQDLMQDSLVLANVWPALKPLLER